MVPMNILGAYGISIHALHEESDFRAGRPASCRIDFNPRSP